ncbi:MAG: LytR/AlgR family response regulator transcription factor [Mongoliitalea sp.]
MLTEAIRYLIVDDDLVSATLLRKYLQAYDNLHFVSIVDNTARANEIISLEKIDLLFLDIEMPGDDGLEFLRKLAVEVMVIFVTSKSKYALTAFDFNPIHFLTKPLDRDKLSEAIRRVNLKIQTFGKVQNTTTYLVIKDKGSFVKVPHDDLIYIEAAADYMLIHTRLKSYMIHMTMKELIELLPFMNFLQIHRSFIVNKNFVVSLDKDHLIIDGKKLPIGPKYKDAAKKIFAD